MRGGATGARGAGTGRTTGEGAAGVGVGAATAGVGRGVMTGRFVLPSTERPPSLLPPLRVGRFSIRLTGGASTRPSPARRSSRPLRSELPRSPGKPSRLASVGATGELTGRTYPGVGRTYPFRERSLLEVACDAVLPWRLSPSRSDRRSSRATGLLLLLPPCVYTGVATRLRSGAERICGAGLDPS